MAKAKKIKVFSCDPGTKNFAMSLIEGTVTDQGLKIKILGTCMLDETLQDLTKDVAPTLRKFHKRMDFIRTKHKPKLTCFERFQSRGLKGKTIEAIGYMLGVIGMTFRKTDPRFILASTWKNRINKIDGVDLKEIYKGWGLTSSAKSYTGKRDHELDAVLIGIYHLHQHLGMEDFEIFKNIPLENFKEHFLNAPVLELPKL